MDRTASPARPATLLLCCLLLAGCGHAPRLDPNQALAEFDELRSSLDRNDPGALARYQELLSTAVPEIGDTLMELAEAGDAEAQMLAGALHDSIGVRAGIAPGAEPDFPEAVKWYRKAAEQNHTGAMLELGSIYLQGRASIPPDAAQGVRWFQRAAEQGSAQAKYSLGLLFARGEGVERDLVEAYKWIALAAGQRFAGAGERLDSLAKEMSSTQIDDAKARAMQWANDH